jgi:hypothetical protein
LKNMEIISDKKLGAQTQEGEPKMPAELANAMSNEAAVLGVGTAEKKDKKSSWPQKAGAVLLGITILASAMAGMAKEAKAGEGFNFSRRAAEIVHQGFNQSLSDASNRGNQAYNAQLDAERQVFNARLELEKKAIQQQVDDRNQVRQLNIEQTKQEIQQINNRINTYEQAKAGAIQKLSEPKADTAAIERQIRLCEGEITKLEQKRAVYLGAATGITPMQAPPQAPRGEYRPMSPSSTSPPQGTFIRRENMPPQTPPPPPQMRPSPGYPASPPASRGEWRPLPQTPPPPPMQPRQNRPVSPPLSYDGKPLPPLPDL